MSELVASDAPASDVVERVRTALVELLHLRACRYEDGLSARPMMRLDHDAQVLLGGRLWGVDRLGLPGPEDPAPRRAQRQDPRSLPPHTDSGLSRYRLNLVWSQSPWPTRWAHRFVFTCAAHRGKRLEPTVVHAVFTPPLRPPQMPIALLLAPTMAGKDVLQDVAGVRHKSMLLSTA